MQQAQNEKTRVEYSIGFGEANLISFFLFFPITVLLLSPFVLTWDYETFEEGKKTFEIYLIPILVGGVVVHELLHGISWMFYASIRLESIKFGMKRLTPYCHCKVPLKIKHYRLGVAMPLIILGILPSVIATIIGDAALLRFGVFFSWVAGGDIILLFMTRNLGKETYVSDHPNKLGFYQKVETVGDI